MKKVMLSIVFLAGILAFVNAENLERNVYNNVNLEAVLDVDTDSDGYKVVKLEELNSKVQTVVSEYSKTFEVQKLEYDSSKKLTRVTLISKDDAKSQKIVTLDDEGKELSK